MSFSELIIPLGFPILKKKNVPGQVAQWVIALSPIH